MSTHYMTRTLLGLLLLKGNSWIEFEYSINWHYNLGWSVRIIFSYASWPAVEDTTPSDPEALYLVKLTFLQSSLFLPWVSYKRACVAIRRSAVTATVLTLRLAAL